MRRLDLRGRRFGRLVATEPAKNRGGHTRWVCQCDCGASATVRTNGLTTGRTRSCGCLASEGQQTWAATHGLSGTRIYKTWVGLRQRCVNPNSRDYHNYGGRGIAVCREWSESFESFHAWALANGYSDQLTLDRIDNDGDYEPANCRWASRVEQAKNTRVNRLITCRGETLLLAEWAERVGIYASTIHQRLDRGWPVEKALFHPAAPAKNKEVSA